MGMNNGSELVEPEQQTPTQKDWFYIQVRHYLALLCFLLTLAALVQTFCLLQVTLVFQSQSTLQEARLKDLTHKLDTLNLSFRLLFTKYPVLNQYCPATPSNERECRPCLAGWLSFGERCYLFTQDRTDWISSQYRCMALGGTLVLVRTEEEQVFLWKQALSLSQGDSYWLGLRSSSPDGGWQWSDGSPMDSRPQFWEQGPDTGGTTELCARLSPGDSHKISWYISKCTVHLKRICERSQGTLQ
ncbi:CD209 antigen-like protein C [Polymixia lowei]